MFVILPSPIPELQHASLPIQNATSQGTCPDSLFFHCFQFGFTFESIKELGGASILQIKLFIFDICHNIFCDWKFVKICFNFIAMATPLVSLVPNNPIMMCFGSQLLEKKLTTITKTPWVHFDIQRLYVHVGNKHSTKVLFTNALKTHLIKAFYLGKFTFKHNQRFNLWKQIDSTILNERKFLIIDNVMPSKNPFYILGSFGNGFEEGKHLEMAIGPTFFHLITRS